CKYGVRKALRWHLGKSSQDDCKQGRHENRLENGPPHAYRCLGIPNFHVALDQEGEEVAVAPQFVHRKGHPRDRWSNQDFCSPPATVPSHGAILVQIQYWLFSPGASRRPLVSRAATGGPNRVWH